MQSRVGYVRCSVVELNKYLFNLDYNIDIKSFLYVFIIFQIYLRKNGRSNRTQNLKKKISVTN